MAGHFQGPSNSAAPRQAGNVPSFNGLGSAFQDVATNQPAPRGLGWGLGLGRVKGMQGVPDTLRMPQFPGRAAPFARIANMGRIYGGGNVR